MLEFYKTITAIRVAEDALKIGEIKFLDFNNGVLGYERFIDKDRIIILVNTLEKEERISLSNIEGRVVDLLDINNDYILINKNIDILISAHKFIILKVL